MGQIPRNAEWYIAEIIEEIRVEGDDRNVVHRNLTLIRADSPEAAYTRALEVGANSEDSYQNPESKTVVSRFRGLGYLDVIHDGLEDGAELLYESKTGVGEDEILRWIRPKESLELFREQSGEVTGPDFSSKQVVEDAMKIIEREGKR